MKILIEAYDIGEGQHQCIISMLKNRLTKTFGNSGEQLSTSYY